MKTQTSRKRQNKSAPRYEFSAAPLRFKDSRYADAQKIGEALDAIRVANGGKLPTKAIWETAKDDRSNALHRHFEWDVKKAAQAHWHDTANALVQVIRIIDIDDGEPKRAFLSIKTPGESVAYYSRKDVARSAEFQRIVLNDAYRDLSAWERRYQELEDLCRDIQGFAGVRAVRDRLGEARNGNAGHQPAA